MTTSDSKSLLISFGVVFIQGCYASMMALIVDNLPLIAGIVVGVIVIQVSVFNFSLKLRY